MKRTDDLQLHSALNLEKQLYALAEVFYAFHPDIKILPDHTIQVVDGTIVSYIFPDGFLRQFDHVLIEDVDAFAEYVPGESLQTILDEQRNHFFTEAEAKSLLNKRVRAQTDWQWGRKGTLGTVASVEAERNGYSVCIHWDTDKPDDIPYDSYTKSRYHESLAEAQ
jgi:hypothetical protein